MKLLRGKKLPGIAIFVVVFSFLVLILSEHKWVNNESIICWDVISYYSYLPATIIEKDITLEFTKKNKALYLYRYWPETTPDGKLYIKTSMGLAFLYAPFFFAGHLFAYITHSEISGFSIPYKISLLLGTLFYLAIGLFFLKKILTRYYTPLVTAITILLIGGGTNLLHYSTYEGPMSHTYNFFLITLFIWLTIHWHEKPGFVNSLYIGFVAGLIALIRPTNCIIILIFVFWDVKSFSDLLIKIRFLFSRYYLLITIIIFAVMVWIPQLIYWKYVTGHIIFFSYGEEKFFFNNPQIISGLFSYRKGWLLYTPVMGFALAGIPLLYKTNRSFFLPVLIYTLVNIYIIYSWWTWWYGGSISSRPMIDSYGLLAIPLATFISFIFKRKRIFKIILLFLLVFSGLMNIYYTIQYQHVALHYDSMTKKAYWESCGKFKPTGKFWSYLEEPDYKKAMKGIYTIKPPRNNKDNK